jgi:hypothetical protein
MTMSDDWCGLGWTQRAPLQRQAILHVAPALPGVYRIRQQGQEPNPPVYVGQTGRSLRLRPEPRHWTHSTLNPRTPRSHIAERHRRAGRVLGFHSMTSSARASTEGGTSILSAFAVLRLMYSSNFVGCSTGNSPGFAPLRSLST